MLREDALTDGVPMVIFSGQVPTGAMGTDAFQETEHALAAVQPCYSLGRICVNSIECMPQP